MTVLVVEHDPDGNITGWGYKADDDYTPKSGEIVARIDHRMLPKKRVDTSVDPPELIDKPNYVHPRTSDGRRYPKRAKTGSERPDRRTTYRNS